MKLQQRVSVASFFYTTKCLKVNYVDSLVISIVQQ